MTFLIASFFFTLGAHAQKGALTGSIIDSDGELLFGANVIVEGSTRGAQSDYIDGKYILQIEEGTYNLIASYLSLIHI